MIILPAALAAAPRRRALAHLRVAARVELVVASVAPRRGEPGYEQYAPYDLYSLDNIGRAVHMCASACASVIRCS